MKRCRTEMRMGDDHKMHRYCIVHRSWMKNERKCYSHPETDDMNTEKKTEDADKTMMMTPLDWPHWPLLPIKRPSKEHFIDAAFLLAATPYYSMRGPITIFHGTIFGLGENLPEKKTVYPDFDAIRADGWMVD